MTYKEYYGSLENMVKVKARKQLDSIRKDGYTYYLQPHYKHIDLLTYPERDMTEDAKKAKEMALLHIASLEKQAEGKGEISAIDFWYWENLKNDEFPIWRQ